MSDSPSLVLNRRQFVMSAALTGAAVAASRPLFAADKAADSGSTPAVPLEPPDAQPPKLKIPEAVPRKIGWAVVGLGELTLGQIMPGFKQCEYSKPVALVSGHADKARRVAEASGIDPKAIYNYENFDRIVDDPKIEVVYIVLPNSMHAEFTIRALKAGKHVLCEKPMAATVEECRQMIAAAKQVDRKLMIAYRLHHEPANQAVMELCQTKTYGKIKLFSSANCQDVQAPNIRLSSKLAGGPVGDVGVYSINAARYCLNEEPVEVFATMHQPKDDPRFREVPESVTFLLRYPSGVQAMCECSFGTARSEFYRVTCEKGIIEMDPAFSYQGQRIHLHEFGKSPRKSTLEVKEVQHFTKEMDHFSQSILTHTPHATPGEEGLQDMRIVEAIMESAHSGRPFKLSVA